MGRPPTLDGKVGWHGWVISGSTVATYLYLGKYLGGALPGLLAVLAGFFVGIGALSG